MYNNYKQKRHNIPIDESFINKYINVKDIFYNEKQKQHCTISLKYNFKEINSINFKSIKPKESTKYKEFAIYLYEKYNTEHNSNNSNNIIDITRDGIRKSIDTIFKSKDQLNMIKQQLIVLVNLNKIITHSILVNQSKENKNRIKINHWNYYFSKVKINNRIYYIELDIRSMSNGLNQYRVQRISTKKVDHSTGVANK